MGEGRRMKRIAVKYNAEQFVNALIGEACMYARQYVKANPKPEYGTEDFIEVYRIKEKKERDWHPAKGYDGMERQSAYEKNQFDNAIKLYEGE